MNKLLILVFVTSAFALSSFSIPEKLPPSATITGGGTVCQESSTTVNLTASGGASPYTFSYSINNGVPQTVSTNGTQINVVVNTSNVGNFQYTLLLVKDGNNEVSNINTSLNFQIIPSPDTSK